ncbi:uncharacterized protein LOC143458790 [Clavelina lepadiformis]|uniref:uncharacterized protein LOC143458790 n=1 Tax=Clavelina lepadiformis TaxID=159417 RepID=UPI004043054D
MDKLLLRPKELTVSPDTVDAHKVFKYWLQTVEDFIATLEELRPTQSPAINKTRVVRSCISPEVFSYVEEGDSYESIITLLKELYVRPRNNVYARHVLVSRQQNHGGKVLEFLRALKMLAKDCTFEAVTASKYRDELIRDSFINGLSSSLVRQRLLEIDDVDLQRAADLADNLERAQL